MYGVTCDELEVNVFFCSAVVRVKGGAISTGLVATRSLHGKVTEGDPNKSKK